MFYISRQGAVQLWQPTETILYIGREAVNFSKCVCGVGVIAFKTI